MVGPAREPGPGPRLTGRRRLLLIGPLPIPGDQIGGAKVSFERLVSDLRAADGLEIEVVNLSRARHGHGRLGRAVVDLASGGRALAAVAARGRRCDAWAINLSTGGMVAMLPVVRLLAALLHRPLGLRVFGGGLHDWWRNAGPVSRRVFRATAGSCRVVALQTQELVDRFGFLGNVQRLPTTRNLVLDSDDRTDGSDRMCCRRLIFLGQIRQEKGVGHLLDAMAHAPAGVTLTLYGSALDSALVERARTTSGVTYGGETSPASVADVLREHDALVLPTSWRGEGMPGVIIEAFQCGLPVIATRWMQIPELVIDGYNGALVTPRSASAITVAIERLVADPAAYRKLRTGAFETGRGLRSPAWSARFADWCLA